MSGQSIFRGNEVKPEHYTRPKVCPEFTHAEASAVAAALTFALEIVGESVPTDSDLTSALRKLAAAGAGK